MRISDWSSDVCSSDLPNPVPEVLRKTATQFIDAYADKIMAFDEECEVAPGVVAKLTGGHTPGHCVVHVASGGERLTFAGDALFPVGFDHPDWPNGLEHAPAESLRVLVRPLQHTATSRWYLCAPPLPSPSVAPG